MREEKNSLYMMNRRYFLWQVLKNGVLRCLTAKYLVAYLAYVFAAALVLEAWKLFSPFYAKGLVGVASVVLFPILVGLGLWVMGYTRRSYLYYCNCIRAGLVNDNGEPPVLMSIKVIS